MKPKGNRIDYPEGSETPADAQPLPDNEFIPPPPPSLEYDTREQEWTDGKEAPAEDPEPDRESERYRRRPITQFKEGDIVVCINQRSTWRDHGGFGNGGHWELNTVMREPHIFKGVYNGMIHLEAWKQKHHDGKPIIRTFPVEEERNNWQFYEQPPYLAAQEEENAAAPEKKQSEDLAGDVWKQINKPYSISPEHARRLEKEEIAAKIREQAAVLAITARLAEKKGLSVKISLETPAPHTSENIIYTIAITEVIKW